MARQVLFATDTVRIEPEPGALRGRRVAAVRAAAPGEVLMRSAALAAVVHGEFRGQRCDRCFAGVASTEGVLKRCGRCRMAHYCGRKCQEADWQDHKVECGALGVLEERLSFAGLPGDAALADALLVGRCLRADAETAATAMASSGRDPPPQMLVELETLEGRIGPDELAQLKRLAAVTATMPRLLPAGAGAEAALDALCRFRNNNFAIVDELLISIGGGVFPRGAALNHSCAPNCLIGYEFVAGQVPVQTVRSVEAVRAGVELTNSYVDIALPAWQRQTALKEGYGFDCGCALCAGRSRAATDALLVATAAADGAVVAFEERCPLPEAPPCAARDEALARADALVRRAEEAAPQALAEQLALLQQACEIRLRWLHPRHLEVASLHAAAHTAAIAAEDWAAAEQHCEELVEQYLFVYPSWHPISGLQMYTLADLKEQRGALKEAGAWRAKARRVLLVTHGEGHALVTALTERLQWALDEMS